MLRVDLVEHARVVDATGRLVVSRVNLSCGCYQKSSHNSTNDAQHTRVQQEHSTNNTTNNDNNNLNGNAINDNSSWCMARARNKNNQQTTQPTPTTTTSMTTSDCAARTVLRARSRENRNQRPTSRNTALLVRVLAPGYLGCQPRVTSRSFAIQTNTNLANAGLPPSSIDPCLP